MVLRRLAENRLRSGFRRPVRSGAGRWWRCGRRGSTVAPVAIVRCGTAARAGAARSTA